MSMERGLIDKTRSQVRDSLQFSTSRTLKALFKKQFLLKIRSISSILEFLFACVIYLILYPIYLASTQHFPDELNQTIEYNSELLPMGLMTFLFVPDTKLIFAPNSELTQKFINDVFTPMLTSANLSSLPITVCDTKEDLQDWVDSADMNALGIYYTITEREPKIEIYLQSLYGEPERDIFYFLTKYTVGQILPKEFTNPRLYKLLNLNISSQHYPRLARKEQVDILFFFMLIACLPLIIAFMPDFQTVLSEKDSKVAALFFLMGMPESIYWFVNFITPIVLSLIPYILMNLCFAFWFYLDGTDFFVLFVMSFLYVLSHISFQYFLSTFMKRSENGRSITIAILMIAIFFSFMNGFYTLSVNNKTEWAKHLFSFIPIAAYQMGIGGVYSNCYRGQSPVKFSNLLPASNYVYSPAWSMLYLTADFIIYLLLFILFNLMNKREFGIAPMKWSDFFKVQAWNELFGKKNKPDYKISNSHKVNTQSSNKYLKRKNNNSNEGEIYLEDVNKIETDEDERIDDFIHVNCITKKYSHDCVALDTVSFNLVKGEVTIIIGPNGAGKSTLLNILSGMIDSTFCSVEIDGKETTFKKNQKNVGAVFQSNVFIELLTVKENLELFGTIRGLPEENLEQMIDKIISTLQLEGSVDTYAKDLSGGQKRKLCVGISMLGDPPIIFMDEPTAGVDLMSKLSIWKTIGQMTNITAVITTHTLEEAESVMHRLFVLNKGKLKFSGTPVEMRSKYKCGYVLKIECPDEEKVEITNNVLDCVHKSGIESAEIIGDRKIFFDMIEKISCVLKAVEESKKSTGFSSFTLSVEHLEDVLMKILYDEESNK
ncbi:ABC transporter family protein [Tritrichomonas foetus]|uniref:ABC transporter family protein n=1 Tax=Tritrichomonas foetus TaxID=1144522 RepID=A0A1J4K276_9EUKA|nr:ABC transporter family protein [Tritrichomonas foetus]|eukprot:OHT03838.1 ABC transporter family protein [Tritrichomonas foetus]